MSSSNDQMDVDDDDNDDDDQVDVVDASLIDALLVYVEPLAANAHAIVVGDAETGIADRLLELGARGVHVFDPDPARAANASRNAPRGVTVRALVDDLDVRDGAFDLAIVPDLADLNDQRAIVSRLRRAVAATGAVVAMGRAKLSGEEAAIALERPPFPTELGPASLEYAELYDMFAVQFDEVSLAGVVPFQGVVFAELGGEDESPAVSVDTRLASVDPPSVFVVIAGQLSTTGHSGREDERAPLDPYAIVQISPQEEGTPREETLALETAFAAVQLKGDLLAAQLDETRDRLVIADVRSVEAATRLDRASAERDNALTRAMELEAVLAASQQTMATLERRLLEAEQGMLERDDRIAALNAELDSRRAEAPSLVSSPLPVATIDVEAIVARAERAEAALGGAEAMIVVAEAGLAAALAEIATREENAATYADTRLPDITSIVARAERAEAALALNVADLAHLTDAHVHEHRAYEDQLRDRARFIAALEKELIRREHLVKELVASLEESREHEFEAAPVSMAMPEPVPAPVPVPEPPRHKGNGNGASDAKVTSEEVVSLKQKLDALATEVARREAELEARAWRITELENLLQRSGRAASTTTTASPTTSKSSDPTKIESDLAHARDELDALRQALTQEHSARLAAESGEELTRARAELARQATLLEQMRSRAADS